VVAERLCDLLNGQVTPVVPARGSVGASGDLAPLAHMALVLAGEGEAEFDGARMPGAEALRRAGIEPIELQSKEGISLLNGTQAMLAAGSLALEQSEMLARAADVACAMSLERAEGHAARLRSPDSRDPAASRAARIGREPGAAARRQRDSRIAHCVQARAGRLLAALRAAGAWRGARHARRKRAGFSRSS